ncbi:MAG: AI-2E family transporter [Pseudomonadota bacterium]
MIEYIRNWYQRHFSDPQVVILALFIIVGFAIVIFAGDLLAPLLASIVIAYVLDGAVEILRRGKIPRFLALGLVFSAFIALLLILIFGLLPKLSQQLTQFFRELPNMISQGQSLIMQLPDRYPSLAQIFTEEQITELIWSIRSQLISLGHNFISQPLESVVGLLTIMVYLILVPLLVFFFLKDKEKILNWLEGFLPTDRELTNEVWFEVNQKIASYIRGKFLEVFLIWSVTYVTFVFLGLQYAMLLSFLVGISVIIPYVGAAVVTIPVAFVAYFQWGFGVDFAYVLIAYTVIQFLDGNILVPLLFSEVVNLHPVAIISAVLVFGGIWGLWGVFFAIPLATLVNAVIKAWPTKKRLAEAEMLNSQKEKQETTPA